MTNEQFYEKGESIGLASARGASSRFPNLGRSGKRQAAGPGSLQNARPHSPDDMI
jgi:hypothetical protein